MRGGYARIFGRLNVNLVLSPLLGVGLIQATTCQGASSSGLGIGKVDPTNAVRIGPDGMTAPLPAPSATLAQPFYPGLGGNVTGDASALDPNYKPDRTDQELPLALQCDRGSNRSPWSSPATGRKPACLVKSDLTRETSSTPPPSVK